MAIEAGLRIGELSERVRVSTHTLRAWERRYGLLRPSRTMGGYRLYGPEDERRVRAVLKLQDQGVSVSEAAAQVLAESSIILPIAQVADARRAGSSDPALMFHSAMLAAVTEYDEGAAQAALDELLRAMGLGRALDEAVMPFLVDVGQRWERGELTVAHEHFASAMMKQRFVPLTVTRGSHAPIVVLAAPQGEQHDLPLVLFSALLSQAGLRTRMVGANTPAIDLISATVGTAAVVLAATAAEVFSPEAEQLRQITVPVLIAGRGATAEVAGSINAQVLPSSLQAACDQVLHLVKDVR